MYKINTIVHASVISEIFTSVSSSTLWPNGLGHVNYRKMFNMQNLGLLSNYVSDKPEKCEVCIHVKITRSPFSYVTRSTNLLDLIN